MAKDGTNRGGRRTRSGPQKDALADKVIKGRPAEVMSFQITSLTVDDMPEGADIEGHDMPKPSEYLSARQQNGKTLGADRFFTEVMQWLKERGCDKLVNPHQVESYAEARARYIQCSEALSKYGLIGKHPTTKLPTTSPFVSMELQYQKQANIIWNDIFNIVRENSLTPYEGIPTGDGMEQLIMGRKSW